jgi:hypothetical protein
MRKIMLVLAAATAASALTAPAFAHPEDEFGSYRGPSTSERAEQAIANLIAQKKLPASWSNAKLASFDSRSKNGTDEYVLTYENPAVKQVAKRKLYVIMSTSGSFISASHKLS